ncbi:hypothetical protein [Dysgonomonas macrotermitis]|nr:hypothetical protein [Dysgonomonas macrotermitis]
MKLKHGRDYIIKTVSDKRAVKAMFLSEYTNLFGDHYKNVFIDQSNLLHRLKDCTFVREV